MVACAGTNVGDLRMFPQVGEGYTDAICQLEIMWWVSRLVPSAEVVCQYVFVSRECGSHQFLCLRWRTSGTCVQGKWQGDRSCSKVYCFLIPLHCCHSNFLNKLAFDEPERTELSRTAKRFGLGSQKMKWIVAFRIPTQCLILQNLNVNKFRKTSNTWPASDFTNPPISHVSPAAHASAAAIPGQYVLGVKGFMGDKPEIH